jgi:flagellar protein FliS
MMRGAANAYKRVDLASAPPTQIVDRLFARFLRDTADARDAIARGDIAGKSAAIDHAMRIACELRAALDHAAAPELCANLASLYSFVGDRLTDASMTRDPKFLDAADRVMREVGDAFRTIHGGTP